MWLRMDDGFMDHPKIIGLSDRAFRRHVLGMLYSARHLTDGHVPTQWSNDRAIRELVDAGLWKPEHGGYAIHDWAEWNPTAESVHLRRQTERERKRRQRRGDDGRFSE